MRRRLNFQCWNCPHTYSLYRPITKEQRLIVACPYCGAEAVADLMPHRKKVIRLLRTENGEDQEIGYEYSLPEILPTQEPDEENE